METIIVRSLKKSMFTTEITFIILLYQIYELSSHYSGIHVCSERIWQYGLLQPT